MSKYSDYVGFRSSSGESRSIQTSGIDRLTITQSGEWDIDGSGYGTSGQVLTSQGTGKPPTWLPIAGADLQEFSTSSTWNKPNNCQFVLVEAWGAGGGGGGGGLSSSGSFQSGVLGGGAGGGGGYKYKFLDANNLPSSVVVTIGAGGLGGSGSTSGSTNPTSGFAGSDGGDTSFGSYLIAFGGNGAPIASGGAGGASLTRTSVSLTAGAPRDSGSFGGADGAGTGGFPTAISGGFCGGGGGSTFYPLGGASVFGGAGGNGGALIDSGLATYRKSLNVASGYLGSGGSGGVSQNIWPNNPDVFLRGVSFGNGRFVGNIRDLNTISVSTNNGVNWNYSPVIYPENFSGTFVNIFYDGSKWLGYSSITGSGIQIATSTDLSGWTQVNVTGNTSPNFITFTILYATGLYVAVGHENSTGAIYTSTNLSGWTLRSSGLFTSANSRLFNLTHDGGTNWMAVGQSGVNAKSTDGITWTTGGLVTLSGTSNRPALLSVAGSGATYLAQLSFTTSAPAGSNHGIARTTDTGNTWTTITGVFTVRESTVISGDYSPTNSRGHIVYVASTDRFSFIARSGFYYGVTSGATIVSGVPATAGTGFQAGFAEGLAVSGSTAYVAVFSRAFSNQSGIYPYRSSDGINWTSGSITGITGYYASGTPGGSGGIGCGGGGGAAAMSGFGVSGAASGGPGGNGYLRVYSW